MGLRPLVGLAVGFAVAILIAGKENLPRNLSVFGTTGVLGMSCTLRSLTVL
jgi:hypothetical protein